MSVVPHTTTETLNGAGWETPLGVGFPNWHPAGGTDYPGSKVPVPKPAPCRWHPWAKKNRLDASSRCIEPSSRSQIIPKSQNFLKSMNTNYSQYSLEKQHINIIFMKNTFNTSTTHSSRGQQEKQSHQEQDGEEEGATAFSTATAATNVSTASAVVGWRGGERCCLLHHHHYRCRRKPPSPPPGPSHHRRLPSRRQAAAPTSRQIWRRGGHRQRAVGPPPHPLLPSSRHRHLPSRQIWRRGGCRCHLPSRRRRKGGGGF